MTRTTPTPTDPDDRAEVARLKVRRKVASDALLRSVGDYIKAHGGKAIVAGPVEIQRWPEDPNRSFRLAIHVMGRAPEKLEDS